MIIFFYHTFPIEAQVYDIFTYTTSTTCTKMVDHCVLKFLVMNK